MAGEVQNLTPSLYLRKEFNVSAANAGSGATLQLDVRYDDGFIAYLNGQEVARRNMGFPGMFAYRDQASYNQGNPTSVFTINLGIANALLQPGENLFCVQVHNESSLGAGDLLIDAGLELSTGTEILDGDTEWKYFAGLAEPSGGLVDYGLLRREIQQAPDVLWATPSFDDSTWPTGVGPVGYDASGSPDYTVALDLHDEMRGVTPSVYVRKRFTVTQAEADSAFPLSLNVDFDDGLIVYLNGYEVHRENVGTEGEITAHDVRADGSHAATGESGNPADRSETINLDVARNLLVAGENVLAFQLHNSSPTGSDLFGKVKLESTGASARVLLNGEDALRYFVGVSEPVFDEGEEDESEALTERSDSENDWIEIRNTGGIEVSLDGWSLSDDPSDPQKWGFPSGAVIPANGFYVVIASGLDLDPAVDGSSYAHTNFRLSASGDRVVLTRPDLQVEDQLLSPYPVQTWRYTYGRQSDGAWGFLSTGTPGSVNLGPALGEAPAAPVFSAEGGFHSSALSLTLSSSTPGAVIRFSTDGTDPLDGTEYTGPISITDNVTIRARSLLSGAIPSEGVTHSYLVGESSVLRNLPAMALSGDPEKTFYGPNTSGGPANGEGMFAINGGIYSSSRWNSNGETTAFNNPMASGRAAEKYGSIEFYPLSGEPLRTELGMRAAGSDHTRQRLKITDPMDQPFTSNSTSSTKFQKPSMNISFRPEFGDRPLDYPFFQGRAVTEFESLRVRAGKNDWYNPFIKDELMRRIYIRSGQVGSYGTMHTLWINGVYKGYYNTAERIREGFLQAHYNSKASWDVQQVNQFSSGDPTHWNEMIDYLRTADLTSTSGYAGVHDYLDVDNYIDYILVNAYAAMGDWPHNNWIAARERSATGRWRFYMWDAEGSFGFAGRSTSTNSFTEQLTLPSTRYPTASAMTTNSQYVQAIYTLLKKSSEFRLRMADRAQKQLFNGGALVTSEISKIYSELRSEISPIIQASGNGSFRSSFYTGWIANGTRYNAILNQLEGENAWPNTEAPTINQFGGEIAAGFEAVLSNPNDGGTIYYTIDGSDPRAPGGAIVGSADTGGISLSDDTRVRARVLEGGTWSPEIDVEFTLPFANPTFMPLVTADWTSDVNWSSNPDPYPNGDGEIAVVPGSPGDDRNVNLREPVTIGTLEFELSDTTSRSRVRDRNTGNDLTFSGSGGPAKIVVTGTGEGYGELEVEAGVILADDLRVEVDNVEGDSEYGALRLREGWSGSGGLTKAGSGVVSLTGSGKSYTGATVVELGVLRVTEPAAPQGSESISVLPGGQLRLVSGSGLGEPVRNYLFGGILSLAGEGRGAEILDGVGNGKRGALRYDPGSDNSHAIISTAVSSSGPATIHVEGSTNQLDLISPLGGSFPITKSGGGTLLLGGDQSAYFYPISVESGQLRIQGSLGSVVNVSPTAILEGHGSVASVTGEGGVLLNQSLIEATASNASRYAFVFGDTGPPDFTNAASARNGAMILESVPTGVLELDFYLTGEAAAEGAVSQGGLIVPTTEDLFEALSVASVRVFVDDAAGGHEFEGQNWSQLADYSVKVLGHDFVELAPSSQVKLLELVNGSGDLDSFEQWRLRTFTAAQLADPLVSGPQAAPFGDGVQNLLRYAFGVPAGAQVEGYLPQIVGSALGIGIEFPFARNRDDIRVLVESTEALDDWSAAEVLFDSNRDAPPVANELGRIRIVESRAELRQRFFRVRIIQN
ncbi:MAG: chitobiase/beta-hexosaminidase C-terminal domain-containing protein [Akkermansiaceae bacterium]